MKTKKENDTTKTLSEETTPTRVLNYVCTGKLTLFPAFIIFLACGAGWLLTYGEKGYSEGYFASIELRYGVAGTVLFLAALTLLTSMLVWLVLRVSFVITPTQFKVMKSGLLRSSKLEFDVNSISLHYFRTHFIEERSWLQLVIRENNQFYQIFSWKGKGNQKDRCKNLFKTLKKTVKEIQQKNGYRLPKMNSEIVSTKERNLIGPFSDRLKQISSAEDQEYPLCIEDCVPIVSYDSFFLPF